MERRRVQAGPGTNGPSSGPSDELDTALEAVAGKIDTTLHASCQLTVVWGEEVIQPIQYNGIRVGPLSLTVTVAPGESIEAAYRATYQLLDKLAREQFRTKLPGFVERLKEAGQYVRRERAT